MAKSKPTAAESTAEETNKNTAPAASTGETKAPSAKPGKTQQEKSLIYVGADLQGFKTNTVFSGEIPKKLDVDFIRELVISVDDLPQFLRKKAVSTSREAFCYRKSVEYANTLRK